MRESYLKVVIPKNVKVDPRKNVWYVRVILEINAIHVGDSRLHWASLRWVPAITSVLCETEFWDLKITADRLLGVIFKKIKNYDSGLCCLTYLFTFCHKYQVSGHLYLLPSGCILLMYCAQNWQSALHAKFAILILGHNWDKHLALEQESWNHWLIEQTWRE